MSKPIFVCYPRCTTCKKAEKWLSDQVLPHKTVYGVTVLVDKLRMPSCIVMIFTST